jgi:hypothetical protein
VRTAAAITATAATALLAAACGSTATQATASANTSAVSAQRGWLAFSRCMRSRGVSEFPDPTNSGELPKVSPQQLGVSSSQLESAQTACHSLLPTGGSLEQQTSCLMLGNCPPAEVQQMLGAERKYAWCMRSHGVPNWPDPTTNPQGMPVFDVTGAGIGREFIHSSLFRSPNGECQRVTGGAPVPRQ